MRITTAPTRYPYAINRPKDISDWKSDCGIWMGGVWGPSRVDYDMIPAARCNNWRGAGRPGNRRPIYSNPPIATARRDLQATGLPYHLYPIPPKKSILPGVIISVCVRITPMKLEDTRSQLAGTPYKRWYRTVKGGNSYAEKRLSSPWDSMPLG